VAINDRLLRNAASSSACQQSKGLGEVGGISGASTGIENAPRFFSYHLALALISRRRRRQWRRLEAIIGLNKALLLVRSNGALFKMR